MPGVLPGDRDWRRHPLAPAIEALLAERGLDEADVDLFREDDERLWVMTACWHHDLRVLGDVSAQTSEMADLIPDLDHLQALRRREAMITASRGSSDDDGPWVVPATRDAAGRIGRARRANADDAVPLWAVTASTALLAHLDRVGITPIEVLHRACARPSDPDDAATWIKFGGVHIHYDRGRLHAREAVDDTIDDWYRLTLNLGGQHPPDSAMIAVAGRPLADLVEFRTRPALLAGLNPVITAVKRVDSRWTNAMAAGLLAGLEVGTETLADIPASALAAVREGGRACHGQRNRGSTIFARRGRHNDPVVATQATPAAT